MTAGLLASRWCEEGAMLRSMTHFEQVPLETVRMIIEEQILLEQQLLKSDKTQECLHSEGDLFPTEEQSAAGHR